MKNPFDNRIPIVRLRIVEGFIVGACGQNEKIRLSSAARGEFLSHLHLEQAIARPLDDEDGKSAIAHCFLG